MFILDTLRKEAVQYIQKLPSNKLSSAVDFLRYLYEQDYPLDDFDYELARRADEDADSETVSFDEVMQNCGLTYDDLRD